MSNYLTGQVAAMRGQIRNHPTSQSSSTTPAKNESTSSMSITSPPPTSSTDKENVAVINNSSSSSSLTSRVRQSLCCPIPVSSSAAATGKIKMEIDSSNEDGVLSLLLKPQTNIDNWENKKYEINDRLSYNLNLPEKKGVFASDKSNLLVSIINSVDEPYRS
jgi:hypothetical protein